MKIGILRNLRPQETRGLRLLRLSWLVFFILILSVGCGAKIEGSAGSLIVYSARNVNLIGPLLTRFGELNDIVIRVKYGSSSQLAATLMEEGNNSPADVFYSRDPSSLGAVTVAPPSPPGTQSFEGLLTIDGTLWY